MSRVRRTRVLRLLSALTLTGLAAVVTCSRDSSSPGDAPTSESSAAPPVAEAVVRDPRSALLPATIERSVGGEPLSGQPTQLLYIDKGTADGVREGIKGYLLAVDGAAMLEFVVVAVAEESAVLRGWQLEDIAQGSEVILNVGGAGSGDVWRYFDPEPTVPSTDHVVSEFPAFMERVYAPYKLNDWSTFSAEVTASADWLGHADQLLQSAQLSSTQGFGGFGAEWSNRDTLGPADFVRLAFAIVAAAQGESEPEAAVLEESQREKLADIWDTLYVVSLSLVGAEGDPEPGLIAEPLEKLEAAFQIALLSRDETRVLLSQIGLAWLDERTGGRSHRERSKEIEETARALSLWPPAHRKAGQLVILRPDR